MTNDPDQPAANRKDRVAAGILAIFLGGLGIHQFYLGNIGSGVLRIVLTFTIILAPIAAVIAIVEGIQYLTKSEEEFHQTYVVGSKSWF